MQTVAILPVKRFANAKRRLEGALASGARRALAEAMFTDVLTALRRVDAIDDDPRRQRRPGRAEDRRGLRRPRARRPGRERPGPGGRCAPPASRTSWAPRRCCASPATAPLIDPVELETLLGKPRTAERYVVIVPDRHGTGTNGLLLAPPDAFEPRYGPGSFARHLELRAGGGVTTEVAEIASLALDVDTPDDLAALQERARGARAAAPRTRAGCSSQLPAHARAGPLSAVAGR